MRLASRFFRRADKCLAPATPSDLLSRSAEAATDLIEATRGSGRGRSVATAAAVGVTLVVATAAYVWWKRRDQVAVADAEPAPVPAPFAPIATTVAPAQPAPAGTSEFDALAEPVLTVVATEHEDVDVAPVIESPARFDVEESAPVPEAAPVERKPVMDYHECGDARRATPQPSVASTPSMSSPPPSASGRFAMPDVRAVVLPGGGRSLP